MKISTRTLTTLLAFSFFHMVSPLALADGSDGFGQLYNYFFGDLKHRMNRGTTCGTDGDTEGVLQKGVVGTMDNIFCHLEKDLGITGTGNITKVFLTLTVKCAITGSDGSGSSTVGSVAYDRNAMCWASTNGTSYNRLMNLSWSFKSDKTVNKANMLLDPTAFTGSPGSGVSTVYDLGSASSSQMITIKQVSGSSKIRGDATISSSGILKMTAVLTNGVTNYRFNSTSSAPDATSGIRTPSLANYEITGGPSSCTSGEIAAQISAASDTPSCGQCFTGAASGTDVAWTQAGSSSCSALTLSAYPSDSLTAVGAYTADTSSTSIMGPSGNWNGMASTPTF